MAKNSLNDWSTTPSGNTDIAGTNIAYGCPPGDVGTFMRTVMAQIAYAVQGSGGAVPATWYVGALYVGGNQAGFASLGDLKHSGLSIEANGWRLCYGQARPRTDPLWAYLTANSITWPYGNGDGSTTYTMPDVRGRGLFGLDNMGGTAANRITNAVSGIAGTTLGATGGDQHAQADTITSTSTQPTATGTATSTVTDPGHQHLQGTLLASGVGGAGALLAGGAVAANSNGYTASATTGITVATVINSITVSTPAITSASALTGASQNMPPAMMVAVLMYVGA